MKEEKKDIQTKGEQKEKEKNKKEETHNEKHFDKKKDEKIIKKDEKEIEELKKKLADMTNVAARAQAEVINFKKRKEDETALRLKYCNEDILLKILDVTDNFERAIKMDDNDLSDEVSKFLEGFKMIYTHLLNILEEFDVKEIDVANQEFNPKTSEAVIVEHHDELPANVVVEVLRKGYTYKDKLLRPAMVKVND